MMTTGTDFGKVDAPDLSLEHLTDELLTFANLAAAAGTWQREVERGIFERVLRLGKLAMDVYLAAQGDGDLGPMLESHDGQTLRRSREPVAMPFVTIFGEHQVRGYTYSRGAHAKIALRPLCARMGLPEGKFSHLFEEFTQYFCVEQSFGAAAARFAAVFGKQVSVETLERLNVKLGAQAAAYLDELPTPPADEEAALLVASADGKGVPLVKSDMAKVPAFTKPERPGNRRMATVGCVYSVDPFIRTAEQIVAALFRQEPPTPWSKRPAPKAKQLVARFARREADGEEVIDISSSIETWTWLRQQIERRHRPGQTLVRLMDGQPSLWDDADVCLDDLEVETVDILDIVHVASYVWRAAKAFETTTERREAFAQTRLLRLLKGDVKGVIAGMRQLASKRPLTGTDRKEVTTVLGYFESQRHRMRYDEYLRAGYPIATGVIEGACRHLVKDRMERSGMRWTLEGAQAMLHVRAIDASGYWKDFHNRRIVTEHTRVHPNAHLLGNYQPWTIAL